MAARDVGCIKQWFNSCSGLTVRPRPIAVGVWRKTMADSTAAGGALTNARLGLVGRKVGMTRIFTDDGETVPVTVLDVSNNRVIQVKTVASDAYAAVQVAFGSKKPSRLTPAVAGHYAKAAVEAGGVLQALQVDGAGPAGSTAGEE